MKLAEKTYGILSEPTLALSTWTASVLCSSKIHFALIL
jgi:hypothetical protein